MSGDGGGKVYDGKTWEDVVVDDEDDTSKQQQHPLHPILDGDGTIFVSIPSYRDGKRCGLTLVEIFTKASDPTKIVVGLIEQNYEDDLFCIESYCKEMGVDIYRRNTIRKDTTKIIVKTDEKQSCPHINQIRKVAVHNYAAKGPVWARSLGRKVLGDEEFCLQIDSHMKLTENWDMKLKQEWSNTNNEFGIISTIPSPIGDYDNNNNNKDSNNKEVPRHCLIQFAEIGVPHYPARGDGKVKDLTKPLLSHSWAPGFSFSKCHLEESAPYDPFTPYVMGVEAFARYARFWTRGYDVYTPTQNIVYHNFQENPDGHGTMEWMRQKTERLRQLSLTRIKSYLGLPTGGGGGGGKQQDTTMNLSNLGIYGLGKRRTIQQMEEFLGISLSKQESRKMSLPCGNDKWVPYDMNISPVDNLYDKPDDLDPQPEYPLRNKMVFYKEEDWKPLMPNLDIDGGDIMGVGMNQQQHDGSVPKQLPSSVEASRQPSGILLFILWILGLLTWCAYFVGQPTNKNGKPRRSKGTSSKDM